MSCQTCSCCLQKAQSTGKSAQSFQLKVLPQSYITVLSHGKTFHTQEVQGGQLHGEPWKTVKIGGWVLARSGMGTCSGQYGKSVWACYMLDHVVVMITYVHFFLPLSTHDVTHIRKGTRFSPCITILQGSWVRAWEWSYFLLASVATVFLC